MGASQGFSFFVEQRFFLEFVCRKHDFFKFHTKTQKHRNEFRNEFREEFRNEFRDESIIYSCKSVLNTQKTRQ
jgi:hypothetical protein